LDFDVYSEKLSKYALFVIAYEAESCVGFLAFYLNDSDHFIYVPQIVVFHGNRRHGIGHNLFEVLNNRYSERYPIIKLEVLKDNLRARNFYKREGFEMIQERDDRYLLALHNKRRD